MARLVATLFSMFDVKGYMQAEAPAVPDMGRHLYIRSLSDLPVDVPFRIDWFGNLVYSRDIRHSQPFISVALSEIPAVSIESWEYPAYFDGPVQQSHRWVPVGLLPMLCVGDVWMNGRYFWTPNYATEQFALNIHHGATSFIKSGLSHEGETDFVVPFHRHPFHKEHTQSYCLQVTIDENVRLVIPTIELVRFYYGSSSDLVARLFHAPFKDETFWLSATKDGRGYAHVDLAAGLSGYSAADVARVALNTTARHAAKLISDSCVAASVARERVYPKTFFPFTGETSLKATGLWIESPGASLRTFLVFKILSCSHPFPFISLSYTMKKKPHMVASNEHGGEGTQGLALWKKRKESPHPLGNQEPSAALGKKRVKLSRWIRFPDLLHKDVRRTDPETPATVLCANTAPEVQAWSVGEGGSTSGIRPVDLVDARSVQVPRVHPAVTGWWWRVVESFADRLTIVYPTVQFIPLDPRQRFPQISTLPQMVNGDGEIHPLCLVRQDDHARARHVTILRFAGEGGCGLAIIPEVVEENGLPIEPVVFFLCRLDLSFVIDGRWLLEMLSDTLWCPSSDKIIVLEFDALEPDVVTAVDKMLNHCTRGNCHLNE